MAGIYVHIPFCKSKCAYCDFVSRPVRTGDVLPYLQRLYAQIEREAPAWPMAFHSVYIGGGTPSLLEAPQAAELMDRLRARFRIAPDAEITLEGNPGTFTPEKLEGYRAAGINRLSLGAQASQARILRRLSRIHAWEDVTRTVRDARAAGFERLSLDLMYGLPEQSPADFRETLHAAVSLSIPHLSCYSLILEAGTPMARWVESGEMALPGEDDEAEMAKDAQDILSEAGLSRYEVSNYAMPGHRCRHNLLYWQNGEYLGLGAAAHGRRGNLRFENTPGIEDFKTVATEISAADDRFETVMMGLRLVDGINMQAFSRRFGVSIREAYPAAVETGIRRGLLEVAADHLRATPRGMDILNTVLLAFLEAT